MSVSIVGNSFIQNNNNDAGLGKNVGFGYNIVKVNNEIGSINKEFSEKNLPKNTKKTIIPNLCEVKHKVNASRPHHKGVNPVTAGASPRALINLDAPDLPKPPPYSAAAGNDREKKAFQESMDNYIKTTLLPEVNRYGKPPLLLRPIAKVLDWFGCKGFGETNCLSCATAVADTFKQGTTHRALPTLRGGRVDQFATLAPLGRTMFGSVEELADKLHKSDELAAKRQKNGDINAVLNITRPFWRSLFSPVSGHASNIIKIGDTIRLVDAQKKVYKTIELNPDVSRHIKNNPSIPLNEALLTHQKNDRAKIVEALTRFIGPVASGFGAITTIDVGFKQ